MQQHEKNLQFFFLVNKRRDAPNTRVRRMYKFNESTCPNDIFTLYLPPNEKKKLFLYWKLYVHNTLLVCPIRACTVISWSFKCLSKSDFYLPLAVGQVLFYVAPW